MRLDVVDLQAYYATSQGQLVRRLLTRQIRQFWPDVKGMRVVGLGYAVPFIGPIAEEAERTALIMPESQRAARWPEEGPCAVALGADTELPLLDRSVDRILLVHALEPTEHTRMLLREVWRVLADGGEALVVVPNRRGLWCLSETNPFGQGRPYSSRQLKDLLKSSLFAPKRTRTALFVPPMQSQLMLRTAMAWERVGMRWARRFAGVMLMSAEKQIYAAPFAPATEKSRLRAYVPIPRPLAAAEKVRGSETGANG